MKIQSWLEALKERNAITERVAFTTSCRDDGWHLGLAVEHEPGYYPVPPSLYFQPFGNEEAMDLAQAEAQRLNSELLGLDHRDALLIVCSSMSAGRVDASHTSR